MDEIELAMPRADRSRGRRTALAFGTAAALAVGVGGFAAGRLSAPSDRGAAAGDGPAAEAPAVSSEATSPSTVAVPAMTEAASVAVEVGDSKDAATMAAPSAPGAQFTAGAWEEPLMPLLAERTTGDGITIRVHRSGDAYLPSVEEMWPGIDLQGWAPADWCFASGSARVSIRTASAVNLTYASLYDHPRGGLAIDSFAAGYAEGSPVFGLVVQAPGATAVTMTTGDGRTDTAPVEAGFALLAVPGTITPDLHVTVDRPDGQTTLALGELAQTGSSEYREACEPPLPVLPAAGPQPTDPAADEAAFRIAVDAVYSWVDDPDRDRSPYIEDTTGIADARDRLLAGPYSENAGTAEITIKDLVFTSPTEVWYRYDVHTSVTDFVNRYGIAHRSTDGTWQLTRATICQDLALAPGAECDPPVDQIYPPSAENDPRYNPRYYETHPMPGDDMGVIDD